MVTIKKGLLLVGLSKVNSRLSTNVSNVSRVQLGDLYKQNKLQIFPPMFISKFMHSLKIEYLVLSMV